MKAETINIDQKYWCSHYLLDKPFIGTIIKKNVHTCIVEGIEFDSKDNLTAHEMNSRFVVKFEQIKKFDYIEVK